ncbi:sterile alpha motif domain-containing protein 13-like isoform X1 [Alosa sapidissima]|uniref:sterile alpha motif domain-containing protein 13-like isoform X1 n=1 Tax=Alosa sapidissima TaxID=34773 RepID=UPI001C084FDC|nr:sterile alpha motif domain-containing protein 13-like isoform X1 [Alosa sapidissima]
MLLMDEPSDQKQSSVKMPADLLASDSKESADMENKTNGSVETKNNEQFKVSCSTVENGQFPDPSEWAVTDVVDYFKAAGFEEQADAFKDQEIDGKSLLLMTRNDVLTGLSIKLGPALKIYEYHVKLLQTQHLKTNAA